MIKVNLLRDQSGEGSSETEVMNIGGEGAGSNKDNAIKFVLFIVFALILYLYGGYNTDSLKEELAVYNQQLQKIRQDKAKKQSAATKAKSDQKIILELEDKIKVIKELSRTRLRELKALDYLQNVLPEKVWIKGLKYSKGKMDLDGNALSDDSLNSFIDVLESGQVFTDVVLLKSTEAKQANITVKQFQLVMRLVGED